MDLYNYDQIIPLGDKDLGVSGRGAHMFRRSAIVKRDTLSTVVAFPPDIAFIGMRNGEALVADTCCNGLLNDSSPAAIDRVSLSTGETTWSIGLYPYAHPLPPDQDLPGAGTVLVAGNRLYVATHSALFVYDLAHLNAQPRMLYGDLLGYPIPPIDQRYFFVSEGTNRTVRRVALFDADAQPAREVWSDDTRGWTTGLWEPQQGPTLQIVAFINGKRISKLLHLHDAKALQINGDCTLQTSDNRYALTYCPSPDPARSPRIRMYVWPR